MPRFLIERTFGNISESELGSAATKSKVVAAGDYPDITWEHSHVVHTPEGAKTYCVYAAPSEEMVRDHASAAGLPIDRMFVIEGDVSPGDLPDEL